MPPDDQTAVETDTGDDIKSLLGKAFDEHEAKSEPVEKPDASETRSRGPDGKFVKAEAPESEAPEEPAAPETQPVAEEKPETQEKAATEAPATWKAEDKETFKGLPAEAQQFLLRRHGEMEADYTRKMQQHSALVRDYEPIRQHFEPFQQQMRAAGMTPLSLITGWSQAEQTLVDPQRNVSFAKDIIDRYRIDKAQLARALGFTPATSAGGETPPPPEGSQLIVLPPELQRQLDQLTQGHQQVTQLLTAQQQAAQREAEGRAMNTIEAFRNAKDPSGNLLHPHFDELEFDMVELWKIAQAQGQQLTLDDVYDRAVWANTSTRQKQLEAQNAAAEAQRQKAEKQRQDEARAKAERARKAAASVTGAPGSSQARMQGQPGERSLRDELMAAADELSDA